VATGKAPGAHDVGLGPISPELILVSSPEDAQRARELLPAIVPFAAPTAAGAFADIPAAPAASDAHTKRARSRTTAVPLIVAGVLVASGAFAFTFGKGWTRRASPTTTPTARRAGVSSADVLSRLPAAHAKPSRPSASLGKSSSLAAPRSKAENGSAGSEIRRSKGNVPKERAASNRDLAETAAKAFVSTRLFAWPASPNAMSYIVRFFRDARNVFEARTAQPRVVVPMSVRFTAGRYRWQAFPVFSSGGKRRTGPPTVDSTFVVYPPAGVARRR
jgi:hypothetical protein